MVLLLVKLSRAIEAKPLLIKAAALNSDILKYWAKLAEVQFILEDKRGLEDSIRHILRLNPSDASHWSALGVLLYEQHWFGAAEDAWIRAVKLNPLDSTTWFNLSSAKIMLNKYAEAELCARKSIRLNMVNMIKSCKESDSLCVERLEKDIRIYHDSDQAESLFHAEVIYAVLEKYHADKVPISAMQRYRRMLDAPSRNKGTGHEDFNAIKHYYHESFEAGYPVSDMYFEIDSVMTKSQSYTQMNSLVILSYKALIDHYKPESEPLPQDNAEFYLAKNQAIETLSLVRFK